MSKLFNIKVSQSLQVTLYVLVALIVIVGLLVLLNRSKPNTSTNNFERFAEEELEAFEQDDTKTAKIVLVYANWCPYCEEYLADKAKNSDKNVFDTVADKVKNVRFEKLDVAESKENQSIANSYGVQGYPTIVASHYDTTKKQYVKVATFEGNRNSVEELTAFAKEHVS